MYRFVFFCSLSAFYCLAEIIFTHGCPIAVGAIPFLIIRQHNKRPVIQSRVASPQWLPGLMLEVRLLQELVLGVSVCVEEILRRTSVLGCDQPQHSRGQFLRVAQAQRVQKSWWKTALTLSERPTTAKSGRCFLRLIFLVSSMSPLFLDFAAFFQRGR